MPSTAPEAGLFGRNLPFEVWINGAEQPRGLAALAKTLSMDLRTNDAAWLRLKLDASPPCRWGARFRDAHAAQR